MDNAEKQSLRHICLEVLAARHPNALSPTMVRNRAAQEVDFKISEEDVTSALEFLVSAGNAEKISDDLGATSYYRASSAGVLFVERKAGNR